MNILLYSLKQACLLLIAVMVVVLGINVFMRYALSSPFFWTGEFTNLLLVWLSFLGVAVAAAERRHMVMDLLGKRLPATAARTLEVVISVAVVLICAYVVYSGVRLTAFNRVLESEELQISYAFFYAAVPVGFLCYLVFELGHLKSLITRN